MDLAACKGRAPIRQPGVKYVDGFFPSVGETAEEVILRYCFRCEVSDECLDYANRKGITTGVWGAQQLTTPRKADTE